MNLFDYGFNTDMLPDNAAGIPARVTAVHKERFELVCENGECFGRLKSAVYYNLGNELFPTTGDFVLIDYNPSGDSRITATLPRKTYFSRRNPSPGMGEQAVAANFDYVFIMQSMNANFNPKRLERYVTSAWQSGATPVVILTKADLCDEISRLEMLEAAKGVCAGVCVHAISSKDNYGLEALSEFLRPRKTLAFLGSSGVGKSTLINSLAEKELMATDDIREDDGRGKHTTTYRQLIRLDSGVLIIDTPGMRELGMWDVSLGLGEAFSDIEKLFCSCRFSDCTHNGEPGCAIRAAIDCGELSAERWKSYLSLKKEARYSDDRTSFMQKKRDFQKAIALKNKKIKSKR